MGTLDFYIPLFFDRLLLDREVGFTFVLMGQMFLALNARLTDQSTGSLWTFCAVVQDFPNADPPDWTWSFELTETHSTCAYKSISLRYQREATITLGNSGDGRYSIGAPDFPTSVSHYYVA